jgi:hypothetical protein
MGMQMTGGLHSTWAGFDRYRTVGAVAKDMLVRAAAAHWKVAPAKLHVARGEILYGKQMKTYGQLAEAAMKLAPPAKVTLKQPKDWKLIGTRVRRIDTPEKITGKAQFGIDVQFPGLRTAVVLGHRRSAQLVKFDARGASILRRAGRADHERRGGRRPSGPLRRDRSCRWSAEAAASPRPSCSARCASRRSDRRDRPRARQISTCAAAAKTKVLPSTTCRTSRTRRWSRSTAR